MMRTKFLLLALLMIAMPAHSQTQNDTLRRMQWFQDAKLGIFIHWGIYAVNGISESWSFYNNYLPYEEYMEQCKGFKPTKYKPEEWVGAIKRSGAR